MMVGGFPAEGSDGAQIAKLAAPALLALPEASSVVISLPLDELMSPLITQGAHKNPWILIYIRMIINANKIFIKTPRAYADEHSVQKKVYAADLCKCILDRHESTLTHRCIRAHEYDLYRHAKSNTIFCCHYFLFFLRLVAGYSFVSIAVLILKC